MRPFPAWLLPVREAATTIEGEHLSTFLPPPGATLRQGAVLILFSEGPSGGELLLTERAHDMRSHPGQVSFPGGSVDPGESAITAALREAEEEVGVAPDSVEVFGLLPQLWLPPSGFAVTPVLGWWREPAPVEVVSHAEVHAIHHAPIDELLDPEHRVSVRHPRGHVSPGFLIGEDKDVILWGFTGGIVSKLFDYVGWTRPWDSSRVRDLPAYMLQGDSRTQRNARAGLLDISDEEHDRRQEQG